MNLFVSLKYLVALDDHRHFGRAALASCVTQPALSNALRALEENFGTAIIKRGRNFAGFTTEGERILASARRILREHEIWQQDLHSGANDPKGYRLIGAVPTAIPIAARFAAMLQDRHPVIVPVVRSMSSVELETGLESLCRTNMSTAAQKVRTRCASAPTPINCAPSVLRARSVAQGGSRPSEALWTRSSSQAMCRQVPSIAASMRNATVNTAPLTPSLRSAARMSPP